MFVKLKTIFQISFILFILRNNRVIKKGNNFKIEMYNGWDPTGWSRLKSLGQRSTIWRYSLEPLSDQLMKLLNFSLLQRIRILSCGFCWAQLLSKSTTEWKDDLIFTRILTFHLTSVGKPGCETGFSTLFWHSFFKIIYKQTRWN